MYTYASTYVNASFAWFATNPDDPELNTRGMQAAGGWCMRSCLLRAGAKAAQVRRRPARQLAAMSTTVLPSWSVDLFSINAPGRPAGSPCTWAPEVFACITTLEYYAVPRACMHGSPILMMLYCTSTRTYM
jgi:hypothetical protein